jgi:hypothetical protein
MGLFAESSDQPARPPGRMEDLHGPWQGTVVLPVHLSWYGMREFDVAREKPRLQLYSIVISKGRPNDLARFINPHRLRDDWPQLRQLIEPKTRRAWERRLGLPRPRHHARVHRPALARRHAVRYARLMTCAST